jgi:sugar phosphate isomerase/epimerase
LQSVRELGIFTWFGYRIPIQERLRLIREAGFQTVLHWWDDSFIETEKLSKEEQADLIRREGLRIENAHLQFDRVNHLWLDTQDGQAVFEGYLSDLDGLAEHDIPTAVLHHTTGSNPPPVSDIGMYRMRMLTERAEQRGVRLAMENVRNTQILVRILDQIDSPFLGLCYDSGHDYIWSPAPYELLRRYQNRLFAVHLHDNLGQDDDHLAPGTGKINWELVREELGRSSYAGSFTLEGDSTVIPEERTPEEHLSIFYSNAYRSLMI